MILHPADAPAGAPYWSTTAPSDGSGTRSLSCQEWAMHEIVTSADGVEELRVVFGIVLPPDLDSVQGFYPYQYPKSRCYGFCYRKLPDGETAVVRMQAVPFDQAPFHAAEGIATPAAAEVRRLLHRALASWLRTTHEHLDPTSSVSN